MAARRRATEPRYDEFGNFLGDFEVGAPPEPTPEPAAPPPAVDAAAQARSVAQAFNDALPAAQVRAPNDPPKRSVPEPQPESRPLKRVAGHLHCDALITLLGRTTFCSFSTNSELELMLHKADRHLVYPPGGKAELRKRDPMAVAEDRERARRGPRGDGPPGATITGLNIQLNTPELISEWIKQRKKRYPTAANVAQKQQDAQRRMRPQPTDATEASEDAPAMPQLPGMPSISTSDVSDSGSDTDSDTSDSDTSSGTDTDSGSDMDPEKDAVSSKIPPPERVAPPAAKRETGTQIPRRQPRLPPPNPFEPPDLLRQLLGSEITVHIGALAQWFRFVLDNDMLLHVEKKRGDAHAQASRRGRIKVLGGAADSSAGDDVPGSALPLTKSPTLRPLDSLNWPPEPDPLIYLDPLRRDDPKPFRLEELEALATDHKMRNILTPSSSLDPHGVINDSLYRALSTWDALPTERHREAALEIILGVGAQSPRYAHEAYSRTAHRTRTGTRGRVISEAELFRHGLRVGPSEVRLIQHMAERIGAIASASEFSLAI